MSTRKFKSGYSKFKRKKLNFFLNHKKGINL